MGVWKGATGHTSVNDVVLVQVVNRFEHLSDRLRGVLLCEFPPLADAVKEFPARGELGDDVVLVLIKVDISWRT